MTTRLREASLQVAARIAGLAYLAIIIVSLLSLALVESRLVVDGDAAATTANLRADALLFRVGLVVDLAMFAGVVLLSWALYVLLRTVDQRLALLALLWRMTEAVLGVVTVLIGLFVALLIDRPGSSTALVDLFLRARAVGFDVVVFFLCLGTIVFCYLLFRSRYVPRALAGYGIVSFAILLIGSLVRLLAPEYAAVAMVSYAPGILFELGIGAWLLVKGVDLRQGDDRLLADRAVDALA
jgi:hypothetical protein